MKEYAEIIGFCAGFLTSLSYIPQLVKVWKTKSTKDISYLMFIMACTGLSLWITYGMLIKSISLIVANVVTFTLGLSILVMKFVFERQRKK